MGFRSRVIGYGFGVFGVGIMFSLVGTGILSPEEGIRGFGSEIAKITLGLFRVTTALVKAGLVQMATSGIVNQVREDPNR